MINQTNIPIMQKAVGLIYDMSEDTKIQQIAWQREKALHDEATALYGAREEGRAEGEAKGRAEGEAEAAKNIAEKLRKMGLSEEQIKMATDI